jgi:hypothetical protein
MEEIENRALKMRRNVLSKHRMTLSHCTDLQPIRQNSSWRPLREILHSEFGFLLGNGLPSLTAFVILLNFPFFPGKYSGGTLNTSHYLTFFPRSQFSQLPQLKRHRQRTQIGRSVNLWPKPIPSVHLHSFNDKSVVVLDNKVFTSIS